MSRPKEKQAETVDRQSVETERRQIPYSQFVVRVEDYSFREEKEFSGPAMKAFEEEIIATRGITNELFVRAMQDGRFLLLDGHRRFVALGNIIERLVKGFSREMLIPAGSSCVSGGWLAQIHPNPVCGRQLWRHADLSR